MNDSMRQEQLTDVLDAYIASAAGHSAPIEEWIRRYPDFEQEIIEFAASWNLMESMQWSEPSAEFDEARLVLRGMSVVQNLLHSQSSQTVLDRDALFESLIVEGKTRGLEPRPWAQALGLGDGLLRKLDRRLIGFSSIPRELIKDLAESMQVDESQVAFYLQQEPMMATGNAYRSEQAPRLAEPEDFFDAVRADPTISRQDVERWFALKESKRET